MGSSRPSSDREGHVPFEAVIFDLDGVLVDSEIWWDEVRADFAARQGRPWTEEDRRSVMGANSRQWSRTMLDRLALDLTPLAVEREIVDGVVARYQEGPAPIIEGAVEAVRSAGRVARVGLASSAHREVIDAALEALGLADAFAVIVSSDEVEHGKPAPDVYVEAARRLDVRPDACLAVEDSLNGVLAARAAGMAVALVPNVSVPPAPGAREAASVVLSSVVELDRVLAAGPDPRGEAAGAG